MTKPAAPLDYAVFQLSPKRSRCDLFVSSDGNTEKIASGLVKSFVAHLKIVEEHVASAASIIKLEVRRRKNAESWFTRGTLERFIQFVNTPEVLELVNIYDAEMSQLEAARRIYTQGGEEQLAGGGGSTGTTSDDATKKELLRAIDVRLVALQQDLSASCGRASAAGFNIETASELQMFADRFGAHRLNEACNKFISLCERRPNLINLRKSGPDDRIVRSSNGSDMSIDYDSPSSPHIDYLQQPNPSATTTFPSSCFFNRESSVERDDGDANKTYEKIQEKDKIDSISTREQTESNQASRHVRRLSVQDRITMFENKQKENSGGKPVMVKSVELRRLSSDVSVSGAEKAGLRRWSGASDMSIDLSAENKDAESPLCTPSSTLVSQENEVSKLTNAAAKPFAAKPETGGITSSNRVIEGELRDSSSGETDQFFQSGNAEVDNVPGENDGLKGRMLGESQPKSSLSRCDSQENPDFRLKKILTDNSESAIWLGDKRKLKSPFSSGQFIETRSQMDGIKDHGSSLTQNRPFRAKENGQIEITNQRDDNVEESFRPSNFKSMREAVEESGMSESISGSRIREAFAAHWKGVEGNFSSAQKEVRSVRETEVVKTELQASDEVHIVSIPSSENSIVLKKKLGGQGARAELSKKSKVQQDNGFSSANRREPFPDQVITESREGSYSFSTPEQAQRPRQYRGNQDLNNDLKMKADELEKLFAAHKLRGPSEQSSSVSKGKPENVLHEPAISSLLYSTPVADGEVSVNYQSSGPTQSSKNNAKFRTPLNTGDSQNSANVLHTNFAELSVSEASRGKLYDRYMKKRDAKLKEDWSSNRADKEAKLKCLQQSLERSRSEMKAKFAGSLERQDSISSAHWRAERLRSYSSRSIMRKEQLSLDFGDSGEDDDEALDHMESNLAREGSAVNDSSLADSGSRAARGKKYLPNYRNLASSTSHTSAVAAPRSAIKNSTFISGKRRSQPENPLTLSVPNFSDLRKENTKPCGGIKTTRPQARSCSRGKSTSDEAVILKADKSRRTDALRQNSVNTSGVREVESDGVVLTHIKFNDDEVLENSKTKPFLKKGSRARYVPRARPKISGELEPVNNMEDNNEIASTALKDEVEEEEFETSNADVHETLNTTETTIRMDSNKFVHSGSEKGDDTSTFSRVNQAMGTQLPGGIPSSFLPMNSMQDWPLESPTSWNSRAQHPFSYTPEMSDVEASVESPMGSPISWNPHSTNQMENDALARMRKNWGTAQKQMLVTQPSNNLSRKDKTHGIKRLLKFGRKNHGSETLVDWVSATTSEGDDDTEDGRDLANHSSEDLRKSRMGFSHGHPSSDDNFNESEFFNEPVQSSQSSIPAPPINFKSQEDHISGSSMKGSRSFFSFMSKVSESKAR